MKDHKISIQQLKEVSRHQYKPFQGLLYGYGFITYTEMVENIRNYEEMMEDFRVRTELQSEMFREEVIGYGI